jgi:hypothetical protein
LKQGFRKASSTIKSASTNLRPVRDKAAQLIRIRNPSRIKVAAHIVKALVNLSTSSESTHLRVWEEANSQDETARFPYFRFNVQRGMDEIGLEEWRKVEAMADLTRSYGISGHPKGVAEMLRRSAESICIIKEYVIL